MSDIRIIKLFRAFIKNDSGAFAIMYALLLPVLALLLALTIDGSNLLSKQARLSDVVTESLVSNSTHSYSDETRSNQTLGSSLKYHFPQDQVTKKTVKIDIQRSSGNTVTYKQIAAAIIKVRTFLPLTKSGFKDFEEVAYVSPKYNQTSHNLGIKMTHQTSLDMTGVGMDEDGGIWVWGWRRTGQQGNGTVSVGDNVAPTRVQIPPGQPNNQVKNIKYAGGYASILTLDENGDVWGWGQDLYGELGSAVCNGSRVTYNPTPCKAFSGVADITMGEYATLMLRKDGTLWYMGECRYAQCGNGSNPIYVLRPTEVSLTSRNKNDGQIEKETVVLIGSAYEGSLAVTKNKNGVYSVWGWGDNEGCGLGTAQSHAGGGSLIPMETAKNGTQSQCHYFWQDYNGRTKTPYKIPRLEKYAKDIVYIAGGNGWSEALLKDGTVIGWGTHAHLGQGWTYGDAPYEPATNLDVDEPIVIMKNVRELQARYIGSAALTNDNKLYTWGGIELYQVYGRYVTHRADNVKSMSTGKEFMFYTDMNDESYGVGYFIHDKFLLGSETAYHSHPLNGSRPGNPGNIYTINWPGIKMDFGKFNLNTGGGDPKPTPEK